MKNRENNKRVWVKPEVLELSVKQHTMAKSENAVEKNKNFGPTAS